MPATNSATTSGQLAPQQSSTKHVHQFLPWARVVAVFFLCHSLGHSRGVGFNETGQNDDDPDSFWADLIRQCLAVVRQSYSDGCIGTGRVVEWESSLNRRDVDERTRP
jgi:hypothetical protein